MKTQKIAIAFMLSFFLALGGQTPTAHAAGNEKKPAAAGPIYVDLKNIVVPVIKKNGSTGIIALTVTVQVKDEDAQETVRSHMPKLRDAFIRTLYGNLETKRYILPDGALDIENIRANLMRTADRVMIGPDRPIEDLLFQNIAQQTF
jgi:hypothetical protein